MARKDKSEKPPERGRRAVIWRRPGGDTADRSDAAASAGADRARRRGLPLSAAGVLIAALVGVGLYAAWPAIGPETGDAGSARDAASAKPNGNGAPPERATRTAAPEDAAPAAFPEPGRASSAGPERGDSVSAPPPREAGAPGMTGPAAADEPADIPAGATGSRRVASDPVAPAETEAGPLAPDGLGTVRARLEALEARTAEAASADGTARNLERRLRALENDPARARLGPALAAWAGQRAALEARLAEVTTRLTRIEAEAARQAGADGRLVALVLATGELTAALGTSRRFAPALDTLRGIAGEDGEDSDIEAALARLAPLAAAGVPTLDGLAARFPETANAVMRAALAVEDADWIDDTVTRLRQLVTIRRTGGAVDPTSLDGRLAAAETALAGGDLARAIAIVEELGPEAARGAGDWLRDARARREADAALTDLVEAVNARIGARWAAVGAAP